MSHILSIVIIAISMLVTSCASVINFMDPNAPVYRGTNAHVRHVDTAELKVVSYNIAWAKKVDLAIEELRSFPELQQADIIMLQEMDGASVDHVAKELGYNYVYYPGSIHNVHDKDIGNAILSRWSLEDDKKIIFPHKQSWNDRIRTATVATVNVNGRRIRAYNVHAATILMEEEKQLDQIESVVDDVTYNFDYIVIGGDFNTARPGSVNRVQSLFSDAGFERATETAGFTARAFGIFPMTLDHIYTKGLKIIQCGKVAHAHASDHLPLWTILQFKETTTRLAKMEVGL